MTGQPPGAIPPVPAEIANELRLAAGCYADEIRAATGCSAEVAVMTTHAAVQMILSAWRADVDDTPFFVRWPGQ